MLTMILPSLLCMPVLILLTRLRGCNDEPNDLGKLNCRVMGAAQQSMYRQMLLLTIG